LVKGLKKRLTELFRDVDEKVEKIEEDSEKEEILDIMGEMKKIKDEILKDTKKLLKEKSKPKEREEKAPEPPEMIDTMDELKNIIIQASKSKKADSIVNSFRMKDEKDLKTLWKLLELASVASGERTLIILNWAQIVGMKVTFDDIAKLEGDWKAGIGEKDKTEKESVNVRMKRMREEEVERVQAEIEVAALKQQRDEYLGGSKKEDPKAVNQEVKDLRNVIEKMREDASKKENQALMDKLREMEKKIENGKGGSTQFIQKEVLKKRIGPDGKVFIDSDGQPVIDVVMEKIPVSPAAPYQNPEDTFIRHAELITKLTGGQSKMDPELKAQLEVMKGQMQEMNMNRQLKEARDEMGGELAGIQDQMERKETADKHYRELETQKHEFELKSRDLSDDRWNMETNRDLLKSGLDEVKEFGKDMKGGLDSIKEDAFQEKKHKRKLELAATAAAQGMTVEQYQKNFEEHVIPETSDEELAQTVGMTADEVNDMELSGVDPPDMPVEAETEELGEGGEE
jgi:hypothetical protein